jgi:hypothetical protein
MPVTMSETIEPTNATGRPTNVMWTLISARSTRRPADTMPGRSLGDTPGAGHGVHSLMDSYRRRNDS